MVKLVKLGYIDALRGIAILGVVIFHCSKYGTNIYIPDLLRYVFVAGGNGVQLFYFISAYTLMLSMHARENKEKFFLRNFYLRRFFRIAPLFYVAIVYYLWQHSQDTGWVASAGNIISHFLLLHGVSPNWINSLVPGGWSVGDEALFYLILPVLFYKINTLKRATIFFWVTLIFRFVLDLVLRKNVGHLGAWGSDTFANINIFNQLPIFSLGFVFFYLLKNNYRFEFNSAITFLAGSIFLAYLLGIVFLPANVMFTIAFFIIAIALSQREYKIIVNPILKFIGKISFSIYLSHFAVIYWLERYNMLDLVKQTGAASSILNFSLRYCLILGISIGISTILYYGIELPAQRFGRRFLNTQEH